LRPGRRRLLEELLPRISVRLPSAGDRLDWRGLYATSPQASQPSALWVEIGFGGGEHLAEQARRHPEIGFIGAEIFVNGVASLLAHIERLRLENVRVHTDDARPLLEALPDASVGRLFLLFPDPWPKTRHAGRRFIADAALDTLARILADGAEFRFASDDAGYVRWTLRHLMARPEFHWLARRPSDWRERPADWPPTRYEEKAVAAGRHPAFLRFERVPRPSARGKIDGPVASPFETAAPPPPQGEAIAGESGSSSS